MAEDQGQQAASVAGASVPQGEAPARQQHTHARDGASSDRERRLLQHGRSTLVQAAGPALVAKAGSLFVVSGADGDINLDLNAAHGIYFHDMRHLSRAVIRLEGGGLAVLLSTDQEGDRCVVEMTNPELTLTDGTVVAKETIGIRRGRCLGEGRGETIAVTNFAAAGLLVRLELQFAADFADMFVVRGADPGKRGHLHGPQWHDGKLLFRYDGADGHARTTCLTFDPPPAEQRGGHAAFNLRLPPREVVELHVALDVTDDGPGRLEPSPQDAATAAKPFGKVDVRTDNPLFDAVLAKSFADLRMLVSHEYGDDFFAAGVPWYVALFGRDSILTALETLAFDASVAAATLRLLARYQGTKVDPWRDEEPGKVLHELRICEKANLDEIPQTPYYGTVDATPLFIVLVQEYLRWTGDRALWDELRGNVERALAWIAGPADHDGDGFIDYAAESEKGLSNQGWKDSGNSITDRAGAIAQPPIALVEVQGYVYRALHAAAWLFGLDGDDARSGDLRKQAEALKARFGPAFWMPARGTLATALARDGQADSLTSNAGQALWSGIVADDHAASVAKVLMTDDMYSGWGIRTMARGEGGYNPIDYQVGSVWPHDNAIIAAGLKRYGEEAAFTRVFTGLFEAATLFENYRLPEVFAGFDRAQYSTPVHYPVACQPQAWASGAVPYLLRTALGLQPDAFARRLVVRRPSLPPWLGSVQVEGLAVGDSRLSLRYERVHDQTLVALTAREGNVDLIIEY